MDSRREYDRTCFVMMPYGARPVGPRSVDFDSIYDSILRPAIKRVKVNGKSLIPLRADQRLDSRPLVHTMMQDLLSARMVLAELSTPNTNVGYELGTRHYAVPFGTVLVHLHGTPIPFDLAQQLVVAYADVPPDRAYKSVGQIAATLRATLRSNEPDHHVYQAARSLADRMGDPNSPTALGKNLVDAESAAIAGRPLEAAQAFAQATKLEPENPTLHQLCGLMYIQAGQPKDAEQQFRTAIRIDPGLTDARRILSNLREIREPRLNEIGFLSSPALRGLAPQTSLSSLDINSVAEAIDTPEGIMIRMVPEIDKTSGLLSHLGVIAAPELKANQIRSAVEAVVGVVSEYPAMFFPESNRTVWSYEVRTLNGADTTSSLSNLRESFSSLAGADKIDFGGGRTGGGGSFGSGGLGGNF